jgi:hypothetical protein
MTDHDWFIEHRSEFAAQVLDAAETAAFSEHLPHCDACREAVERIGHELRWLPMAAPPATPRPGLQRQILEHALGRAPSRLRRWSLPIGIAASLVSGVIGWQLGQQRTASTDAPTVVTAPAIPIDVAATTAELNALRDTLSIMKQAARIMQARIRMHGKEGGMVIFDDARTHRWNVLVHGLPAAPVDTGYQFWFICADGMVRGARVHVGPSTPMLFTTGMPAPSCKVIGAALTMESARNADGPPRGKELAHILM